MFKVSMSQTLIILIENIIVINLTYRQRHLYTLLHRLLINLHVRLKKIVYSIQVVTHYLSIYEI